ncbi:hypothetical protein CBL_06145 [Carabus blaptoides fortunei]
MGCKVLGSLKDHVVMNKTASRGVHGSLVQPGSVISLITCYIVSALIKELRHGTLEVFYAGDMSLFPGITDSSNRVMYGALDRGRLRPRLIKPVLNPNSRPLFTALIHPGVFL